MVSSPGTVMQYGYGEGITTGNNVDPRTLFCPISDSFMNAMSRCQTHPHKHLVSVEAALKVLGTQMEPPLLASTQGGPGAMKGNQGSIHNEQQADAEKHLLFFPSREQFSEVRVKEHEEDGPNTKKRYTYRAFEEEFEIDGFKVLHPAAVPYLCSVCNKYFENQGSLDYHTHIYHRIASLNREKQKLKDAAERRKDEAEERKRNREAQDARAAKDKDETGDVVMKEPS